MVLTFLKAEIDYSDGRERIEQSLKALGVTRQEIIQRADLDNDYQNAVRALQAVDRPQAISELPG